MSCILLILFNYQDMFCRKDRGVTSWGGSVAIYIKKNVKFEKIVFAKCDEMEFKASTLSWRMLDFVWCLV